VIDQRELTESDEAPSGTSSRATRILGSLVLLGVAVVAWLALVATPADSQLGETVRLMYVHVPTVIVAYLACVVTTVASAVWLWKRSRGWDLVAASSAEVAAVFCGLTLVTGMIWGRPTWGVFWVWDARLTSTLVLFLLLVGYLALRNATVDPEGRARRSAVVGLFLVPNLVIVNRSVEWWRSLHQDPTLLRTDLDAQIDDLMLFTLFLAMVVGLGLYTWLVIHRFRVAWLAEQVDEADLGLAVAARRSEGEGVAS
jgi:heme exporter protein C